MSTVVVVEGESDRIAVETIAERFGLRVPEIHVAGGAQGARMVARTLVGRRLLGLVDNAERRALEPVVDEVFVCDPDLEGELIRALGAPAVERVIADQGELGSFRRLQAQPAQRGRPTEAQLARFISGRSGNKARYARLLAGAVPLPDVPAPLAALVARAQR
ncbi:ATP-dependent endonuclease [Microbacterium candidum]|uniref:ATP-dependent endonuclease n=1 Tax=Microbacterium candidum TaxID=3041922 RepID=A0ABT7MZJ1_9MICO|nr:ATP-dependent endonuclease [Microbacterium sp. ASV49]MDL9979872.1 ATP-dependent endonuclease [Microbacterium sp. ASV49]